MTTLAELAPELLLIIADFLPPVDVYCFSVCNYRHYCLLSRKMNPLPRLTPQEKFSVLRRLERDIPPFFACRCCNILHRYDGTESFGLSGFFPERTCQLPCVQNHGPWPTHWFSSMDTLVLHQWHAICIKKLSFLHLKLAMRRFYYGPECGISTDSLSHIQVSEHRIWPTTKKVIWLFSREAQICTKPLGLYLRVQDILLFPEWRDLIDNAYAPSVDPLVICPHDTVLRQKITPTLWSRHNKEKGFLESCDIVAACNVCNTYCDIELCEIDGQKALVMTRWLNLGPGQYEGDLRWKTHTYSLRTRRLYCGFDPDYPVREQCPKRRFEKTAPQSLNDLRLRNTSYLRDKQYKKIMRYARGWSTWHDPFREPSTKTIINFGRSLQALFGWFPDPAFN